jgi:hypothetical protein
MTPSHRIGIGHNGNYSPEVASMVSRSRTVTGRGRVPFLVRCAVAEGNARGGCQADRGR